MRLIDLTGQRFGRLTVVEQAANRGERTCWTCRCDCGTERTATTKSLRKGDAKSCATACILGVNRRPYPGSPRYRVGDDGSIVGPSGRALNAWVDHNGYLRVRVYRGTGGEKFVHVIVCETFHGPRPDGMQVAHENGVRTDCRAANLSWKTPVQNQADKVKHGTHLQGEQLYNAKLTEEAIRAIRAAGAAGARQEDIGRAYGIHQRTVSRILRREAWRHVA